MSGPVRTVHVECSTPHLFRWFCSQLTYVARKTTDGFVVNDETRWGALLGAAEGRELSFTTTLRDKGRGRIALTFRDGVVVGGVGSEPERFVGLTLPDAIKLAKGRG